MPYSGNGFAWFLRVSVKVGRAAEPNAIARSHSFWFQASSCHHAPELRQGPEAATTSPHIPCTRTRSGCCSSHSTSIGSEGRRTRKPAIGLKLPRGFRSPAKLGFFRRFSLGSEETRNFSI